MSDLFTPEEIAEHKLDIAPPTAEEIAAATPKEPSGLESAARGLEQGATLGFAPAINAAAETAIGRLVGPSPTDSIFDEYRRHREESNAAFQAAHTASPYISNAAELAGGIGLGLATGGGALAGEGAGLAKALSTGAKFGAAGAIANSKEDFSKVVQNQAAALGAGSASDENSGDILTKGATDAAIGGVMGGITGGAIHGAVSTLGKAIGTAGSLEPMQMIKKAFQGGASGNSVVGEQASKAFTDKAAQFLNDDVGNAVTNRLNGISTAKDALLRSEGDPVDISKWASSAKKSIDNMFAFANEEDLSNDLLQIKNTLDNHILGNPNTENAAALGLENAADSPPGASGKGLIMNPSDAEGLRTAIGDLGLPKDADTPSTLKTNTAKELVRRLVSGGRSNADLLSTQMQLPGDFVPLTPIVNSSRPAIKDALGNIVQPGLAELNKVSSALQDAQKNIPSVPDLGRYDKTGLPGASARYKINAFLNSLPDDMKAEYTPKLQQMAQAARIDEAINSPGIDRSAFSKGTKGLVYGAADLAGQAFGEASQVTSQLATPVLSTVGEGFKDLYSMAPEDLQELGNTVGATVKTAAGKALSTILSNMPNKDRLGRNALFFAMQQNPAYREIINNLAGVAKAKIVATKPADLSNANPNFSKEP